MQLLYNIIYSLVENVDILFEVRSSEHEIGWILKQVVHMSLMIDCLM